MPQQEETRQRKSPPTSRESYDRLTESSDEEKVETLAALFFTTAQIAAFVGMTKETLTRTLQDEPESPITKAYRRGKMRTEILLRMDTARFALAGSPEAMRDMKEHLIRQNISEDEE